MPKTIFITGATAGIGQATATLFAKNNYNLIINGRRRERLELLKKELESKYNVKVWISCFDVRNNNEVIEAIEKLMKEVDHIDILVNNAGLAAGLATIDEGDTDNWDKMIDTNIKGLLYVTRQITPLMRKACQGHIFNIGSIAGKLVYKNGNVYCATKFAVGALSQSMRIDLLPYGIKVTAINPGMVETEFSIVRYGGDTERAAKVYEGVVPLTADDIANTVFFCASQPPHVCIDDITLTCLTQANGFYSIKESERIK